MRSAHGHLRALQLKHLLSGTVTICALYLAGAENSDPIGVFTLKRDGRVTQFYDGLLLLPEYAGHWTAAMAAALAWCGSGCYRYGWAWSLEAPRDADLQAIGGVSLIDTTGIVVQGVDLTKWPDWTSYQAAVSENNRRNAKKAIANFPDLTVMVARRYAALKGIYRLTMLRRAMYSRKHIAFKPWRSAMSVTANAVICPSQATVATAIGGGAVRAAMRLIEFDSITYYFEGAAATESGGAAWYLTLKMLENAYQVAPSGKFLLGYYIVGSDLAEGLIRSRHSLRAQDWHTSILTFDYRA